MSTAAGSCGRRGKGGAGGQAATAGHRITACAAPSLMPGRGNLLLCGWHARKFTSSQVTLMIRKEGTYVRAMRITPARQLTLDIPRPGRGAGRDRERVWNQVPDAARTRVLCLLAAMIAAGVVTGEDAGHHAEAVRGDG